MSDELAKAGNKIDFVIINADNAKDDVANLISKCTFPIFQDSDTVKAWQQMGGSKDDFFLYDSAGKLVNHLPISGGPIGTNLGTQADFDAVKKLILSVK